MPKPTKFELMRLRRADHQHRAWVRGANEAGFAIVEPEPVAATTGHRPGEAVPVMEVDGVLYREAPIPGRHNDCTGCAFERGGHHGCNTAQSTGRQVFGSSCDPRRVIYIRAEV